LKGLPLPRTFSGFSKLTQEEWSYLAPLLITVVVILYSIFSPSKSSTKPSKPSRINKAIQLEKDKVVDTVDIDDVEDLCKKGKGKCAVCRCWKSKKVRRKILTVDHGSLSYHV
jgi:hypothetical protein